MKYRILIFLFAFLSVNTLFAQWPPRYVLADVGVFDDFIIVGGDTIRGAAYVNGDTIFTGNGDYIVVSEGGGSDTVVTNRNGIIYITETGAIANDGIDDSGAIRAAFDSLFASNSIGEVRIPSGVFELNGRVLYDDIEKGVRIVGEPGATLLMDTILNFNLRFRGVENDTFTLASEAVRGSDTIFLSSTIGIDSSMWLFIESDSTVETGWGYKESDIHEVFKVLNDTTVIINTKLNFNYSPGFETVQVSVIKPVKVHIEGITFQTNRYTPSAGIHAGLNLSRVNLTIRDCEFISSVQGQTYDHINAGQLINATYENLKFRGGRYGVLSNYVRNLSARNIRGEYLRHIFVPANFSDGIHLENIWGYQNESTLDAHPSFNVTVRNMKTQDNGTPNCRAFGFRLENVEFGVADSSNIDVYAYFFMYMPQVNSEYASLAYEYDAIFDNVKWVHPDGGKFNGLNVPYCNRLIYRNCVSHSVGAWSNAPNTTIVDGCTISHVEQQAATATGGSGKPDLFISNTTFDGQLKGSLIGETVVIRQFPQYPGNGVVQGCVFKNYDSSTHYVTDFLYDSRQVRFDNCTMVGFLDFSKFYHPLWPKPATFSMTNCRLQSFTNTMPYGLTSSRAVTNGTTFNTFGGSGAYEYVQGDTLLNVVSGTSREIDYFGYNFPAIQIFDVSADTVVNQSKYKVSGTSRTRMTILFYDDYSQVRVGTRFLLFAIALRMRRRKRKLNG